MHPEQSLPWWISDGEMRCRFCLQSYSHGMEARCTECDAPICPLCTILTMERARVCPDCAPPQPERWL
jgi:hypothetical protein